MLPKLLSLLRVCENSSTFVREFHCWTAAITKKHRELYKKTYPVTLVESDGRSYTVQYPEPRKIIRLPLDITTLTDAERQARLYRRIKKTKVVIQEDIEDDFDETKYLKLYNR